MNISSIATNFLSDLSRNSDSIIPMATKDTLSNCLIVATYKKNGGKDDARERAIEEFGTGAFWLFGIPAVKKLLDKTVYPLLKLNPDFDLRLMKNQDEFNGIVKKSANDAFQKSPKNSALKDMTDVLNNLDNKNPVLSQFTNKDLYKKLFGARFLISTALSAFALTQIIKFKRKTTEQRIKADIEAKKKQLEEQKQEQKNLSNVLLKNSVKKSNIYKLFSANDKSNENGANNKNEPNSNVRNMTNGKNTPSFTGRVMDFFMYNPVANTSILDGVITTTRLVEYAPKEKKEAGLKELFQMFFIYAIAAPTQKLFEWIGNKMKKPIELDPKVLFSKDVKQEVQDSVSCIKTQGLDKLDDKELLGRVYKLASDDVKNPLIQLLNKNGNISLVKNKQDGSEAMNYLKHIDGADIAKTIRNILSLNKNIDNIKGIKAFKVFSILANVAIGALAMGILQPLVNIQMRKMLHNGDNRNPAIVEQERKMMEEQKEKKE